MADENSSSRLLENSEDYRTCSIAKNSKGYTPGNEYCPTHQDTLADGDCRGRDPEREGAEIGTNIDIATRNKMMAKNADGYTYGNEYGPSHQDTISDGDCRGRDPESGGGSIGTDKDIAMRNCLMAKNSDRYTPTNQYLPGHEDTLADGDDKGREPEDASQALNAGTCVDINIRNCSLAKNAALYTRGNEYCAGSDRV